MELEIPAHVQDIVAQFRSESVDIQIREVLRGGYSGAFVSLVNVGVPFDGIFVLKVGEHTTHRSEFERHTAALACGAFSSALPEIVANKSTGSHYALVLKAAGGSHLTWRPLVDSPRLFSSAYSQLSKILWTRNLFDVEPVTYDVDIVRKCLSYQLDRAAGGRIHRHAAQLFGVGILSAPSFVYRQFVLPNPLYFVSKDSVNHKRVGLILSPVHGDCHPGNIFFEAREDAIALRLCLIDLAAFQEQAPFFFDHAYFELATLLRTLPDLGEERWYNLCAALAALSSDCKKIEQHERAWCGDVVDGRQTAVGLYEEEFPDRRDDFVTQFLLVQVAAGLSFLNKRPRESGGSGGLTEIQYRQAFVWAATFLDAYLTLTSHKAAWGDLVGKGTVLPVVARRVELTQKALADAEWERVGNFDSRGTNILILDSNIRDEIDFAELFAAPWTVVLDFEVEQLPESQARFGGRIFRQLWPGGAFPDVALLSRGAIWYYANGRRDISGAEPTSDPIAWRRRYQRNLQQLLGKIAEGLSPASVRLLMVSREMSPQVSRLVIEAVDTAFSETLAPPIVAHVLQTYSAPDTTVVCCSAPYREVLDRIRGTHGTSDRLAASPALIPTRSAEGTLSLRSAPEQLVARIERDVTVLSAQRASFFPAGRIFGVDFRRGMQIEWAELAANLDVKRDRFKDYRSQIMTSLGESTNATVNLLHAPCAGGTTLARRLGWSIMEHYPTVLIDQLSPETSSYLRDLFNFTSFPLLVIMESQIVTESEREGLLRELREDNTRAVFLWVSRYYGDSDVKQILPNKLSDREAENFRDFYLEQIDDYERRRSIEELTALPNLEEQRSPFFFGLCAFERTFVGLDRLVHDVILHLNNDQRQIVASLALVSFYSNDGFPRGEFSELLGRMGAGSLAGLLKWPFAVFADEYVRIPHVLIAEKTLSELARRPENWRADLQVWSKQLLDHLCRLRGKNSQRVRRLVETLFITRDIGSALEADVDAAVGGVPKQRRFSPLILQLGSVDLARPILERVAFEWRDQPHYAIHYARHLLYEDPRDIAGAIEVATRAKNMPAAADDDAVVHVVGMCHRVRMEQRLRDAKSRGLSLKSIEDHVRADFDRAQEHFLEVNRIAPATEYGNVAIIQMVTNLLQRSMELDGANNLGVFVAKDGRRWYLDGLSLAEEAIRQLHNSPQRELSIRAQRTINQWGLVYGKTQQVLDGLRILAKRYEDATIRRALCDVIVARNNRNWRSIPQADLRTIVLMMDRNIRQHGVRDADMRSWLRAYRHLLTFDLQFVIERLVDWHKLNPSAIEPAFYLYSYNFVKWIDAASQPERSPALPGIAAEVNHWLGICRQNRPFGQRTWSIEWLRQERHSTYRLAYFRDMEYDPVSIIRIQEPRDLRKLERSLARIRGVVRDYRGPQHATLDLGYSVFVRITPLDRITKDDEGKAASAFLAFSYDGLIGWDPVIC